MMIYMVTVQKMFYIIKKMFLLLPNTGVTFQKNMNSKTGIDKTNALWEKNEWNCSCY
jgi:hypothetical protein